MPFSQIGKVAIVTLILGLLSVAGANAQYFGRNKIQYKDHQWKVMSTPHFDIHYYEGGEEFAARAALVMEDGYETLSYKLKEVLPWRVPVILYSAHNDFLQTNVTTSLLPEGVQAFAEPSRRRIVLPFTRSFKEFQHTAIHELAHVFTFQIVYNRLLDNVFSRNYLFGMPLWFAEGLAEYLSVGWDADMDMFVRDAVIHDYLPPIYALGGYYNYKGGQSIFNYLADTYGHEKVVDIVTAMGSTRNAEAALQRTIGIGTEELSENWHKSLKKQYWPLYPNKAEAKDLGRQLTDHIKDRGYYNTKPVISPDGERIVFFSDRDGLIDIYMMSALDGTVIRKLVTGQRSNRFESLHVLTSSIGFSPDGKLISFVAKTKGKDTVYIVRTDNGDVEHVIEIDSDGLAAPSWSPDGRHVVVSATFMGQTDLVLIDLENESQRRLTEDAADQLTPRFHPDGKRIVYTYFPEITVAVPEDFSGEHLNELAEMNFLADGNVNNEATYDIYMLNMETGEQTVVVASDGDDSSPVIMNDGRTLIYGSNVSGVNNLHAADLETGEHYRFTDVLGGVFDPDVAEGKNRITFSAFVKGGWDVFVSDDLQGMLSRRYQETPVVPELVESEPVEENLLRDTLIATGGVGPAIAIPQAPPVAPLPTDEVITDEGIIVVDDYAAKIRKPESDKKDSALKSRRNLPAKRPVEGVTEPVADEEIESLGATVADYKTRLAPDFIGQGAGVYYATGFGFGLSNTVAMSDMLGNHRALLAFNFYRDIAESDILLNYYYLKNRVDFAVGVFQFKNYFNSRYNSIGQVFANNQLFSERNYGIYGLMSVPFNTFYRMDIEVEAYNSTTELFAETTQDEFLSTGLLLKKTAEFSRQVVEPRLAFVHDSALFSYFGPVEGSRWRISASQGLGVSGDAVSRTTAYLDYRWYKRLFFRNSIAFRTLGAFSEGEDARAFALGGPLTLRGYEYGELIGSRIAMASVEYRYPLIDALIFGWPGRWGFTNVGGTVFFDAGAAWDQDQVNFVDPDSDQFKFGRDLYGDFGFGVYFNVGYLLLNMQFAWQTDMVKTGDSQFFFFLGPTF